MPIPDTNNVPAAPDVSKLAGQQPTADAGFTSLPATPAMSLPNAVPPTPVPSPTKAPSPSIVAPSQEGGAHHLLGTLFHAITGGTTIMKNPDGSPRVDENGQVMSRPIQGKKEAAAALFSSIAIGALTGRSLNQTRQVQAQQKANVKQNYVDAAQQRKYTTLKQNLDMTAMSIAANKQSDSQIDQFASTWAPGIDALQKQITEDGTARDGKGNPVDLWVNGQDNLSGDQCMDLLQKGGMDATKSNCVPTGTVELPNPDGKGTHKELRFGIINPEAHVKLTDEIKKEHPQWQHVDDMPVPVLLNYYGDKAKAQIAANTIDKQLKGYDETNGTHLADKFNMAASVKNNRLLETLYDYINSHNGVGIDQFFTNMRANPEIAGNKSEMTALNTLQRELGVEDKGLLKMTTERNLQDAKDKNAALIEDAKLKGEVKAAENAPVEAGKLKSETSPEALAADTAKSEAAARGKAKGEEEAKSAKVAKYVASPVVDQIGTGQMALTRIDYLLSKNPELVEAVTSKYPDFDSSKIKGYTQAVQEYESTKKGSTGNALNAGGTALKHLRDLKKINDENPTEVHIKGTKAYNAYQNLMHTVAGELAQFYNLPQTDQSIQSMTSSLGALVNRNAAIIRQAQSMGEKMDSYEKSWENAKPSKSYEKPMPNVDYEAKSARAELDPNYQLVPHLGDTKQYGGKVFKFDGANWNAVPQVFEKGK